jgi:HemY protein
MAALAAALIALTLYVVLPGDDGRDALPALPDTSSQSPAVREHLRARYDAARQSPDSPAAVGSLCLAFHADMFYDRADACYATVAAMAPQEWRWQYFRALIRADRGGGNELVEMLRRIVARAPDFSPAWLRLGDAEFKAGRYDRASEAWDRAARLPEPPRSGTSPPHVVETPVVAYAVTGLARVALARGDARRAADLLEDVANGAPSFSSAFRLLADAYTALGRQGDAEQARAHAKRLSPFAPYADPLVDELVRESRNGTFLLRAASEADLSVNAEWSVYLARRAMEFDPGNPEVVSKLARVLRTLGRSEEALPYFQRYHEMVPGDYEGLAQLGSCLSDLGRFDEAEPMLREALAGMDDALTRYNLGLLLARTGRLDEARAEYERALGRDPNHANARVNLAAVLARQGDLERAARELSRVVAQDPQNALAHTNLGLVLVQQGQTTRAAHAFEEALRIQPGFSAAADALRSLRQNP